MAYSKMGKDDNGLYRAYTDDLYKKAKESGYNIKSLGESEDAFYEKMGDPEYRRKMYEWVARVGDVERFGLGTYNDYYNRFKGLGKEVSGMPEGYAATHPQAGKVQQTQAQQQAQQTQQTQPQQAQPQQQAQGTAQQQAKAQQQVANKDYYQSKIEEGAQRHEEEVQQQQQQAQAQQQAPEEEQSTKKVEAPKGEKKGEKKAKANEPEVGVSLDAMQDINFGMQRVQSADLQAKKDKYIGSDGKLYPFGRPLMFGEKRSSVLEESASKYQREQLMKQYQAEQEAMEPSIQRGIEEYKKLSGGGDAPVQIEKDGQPTWLTAAGITVDNKEVAQGINDEYRALQAENNEKLQKIPEQADNMAATIEEGIATRRDEIEAFQKEHLTGFGSAVVNAGPNNPYATDPQLTNYRLAQKHLDNVRDAVEVGEGRRNGEIGKVGAFGKGVKNKASDIGTWDFGFSGLLEAQAVQSALDKYQKGEKLSDDEQALLDATALEVATKAIYKQELGGAYGMGESLVDIADFMVTMALAGGMSGIGKGFSKKLANMAVKKYGPKLMREFSPAVARNLLTTGAVVTRGVTDVANSLLLTNTIGGMGTFQNIMQRHQGSVTPKGGETEAIQSPYILNPEGQYGFTPIKYGGQQNPVDWGTAIKKGEESQALSYWMMYNAEFLQKVGGALLGSAGKAVSKWMPDELLGAIDKWGASKAVQGVEQYAQKMHWQGAPSMYASMIEANTINALLVGDYTLDKDPETGVFNRDRLLNDAIMFGIIEGVTGGFKTLGFGWESYQTSRRIKDARATAAEAWQGRETELDKFYNTLDNGTPNDVLAGVKKMMAAGDLTREQLGSVLELTRLKMNQRGLAQTYNNFMRTSNDEELRAARIVNGGFLDGMRMATDMSGRVADDGLVHPAMTKGGELVSILSEADGKALVVDMDGDMREINTDDIGERYAAYTEKGARENSADDIRNAYYRYNYHRAEAMAVGGGGEAGEALVNLLDTDPAAVLSRARFAGNETARQVCLDYLRAKSEVQGIINGRWGETMDAIDSAERAIDSITDKTDGMVHSATLANGERVYVVSEADNTAVVVDERGQTRMVQSADIASRDEAQDARTLKRNAVDDITETARAEQQALFQGELSFEPGEEVVIQSRDGRTLTRVRVLGPSYDAEGQPEDFAVMVEYEDGTTEALNKQYLQQQANRAYMNGVAGEVTGERLSELQGKEYGWNVVRPGGPRGETRVGIEGEAGGGEGPEGPTGGGEREYSVGDKVRMIGDENTTWELVEYRGNGTWIISDGNGNEFSANERDFATEGTEEEGEGTPYKVGQTVTFRRIRMGEDGPYREEIEGEIIRFDPESGEYTVMDEDGNEYDVKRSDFVEEAPDEGDTEGGEGTEEEPQTPVERRVGDTVRMLDDDGNIVEGTIQSVEDDRYIVRTDAPVNGDMVHPYSAEELDAAERQVQEAEANEAQGAEEEPQQSALDALDVDENGEKDIESAKTPAQAVAAWVEMNDGDEEMAKETAQSVLDASKAELGRIQKKKAAASTDPRETIENARAKKELVAEAQRKVDFWQGVVDEFKRQEEEARKETTEQLDEEQKKLEETAEAGETAVEETTTEEPVEETQEVEEGAPGAGYSVEKTQYTKKNGDKLDMYLLTPHGELGDELLKRLKAEAKALKGWYDREKGGFMMRSMEDARKLGDMMPELREATEGEKSGENIGENGENEVTLPEEGQGETKPLSARERLDALGEVVDAEDFILRSLASGSVKFVWGKNKNGTPGLGATLGFGGDARFPGQKSKYTDVGEMRARFWLLAKRENGGLYPEEAAERLYRSYIADRGFNTEPDIDEIDFRNLLIDILRSYVRQEDMVRECERKQQNNEPSEEEYWKGAEREAHAFSLHIEPWELDEYLETAEDELRDMVEKGPSQDELDRLHIESEEERLNNENNGRENGEGAEVQAVDEGVPEEQEPAGGAQEGGEVLSGERPSEAGNGGVPSDVEGAEKKGADTGTESVSGGTAPRGEEEEVERPLTREDVENTDLSQDIKDLAIDYIEGNRELGAEIAYQYAEQYVRDKSRNRAGDSEDADAAYVGGGVHEEAGGAVGQGGRPGEAVDTGDNEGGGVVGSGEPSGEGDMAEPAGGSGDSGVPGGGNKPRGGAVGKPVGTGAGVSSRAGGGRSGGGHQLRGNGGRKEAGSGLPAPDAGRKGGAQSLRNQGEDIASAALKEIDDILSAFTDNNKGGRTHTDFALEGGAYSAAPILAQLGANGIKLLGASTRLGYGLALQGHVKFDAWKGEMNKKLYPLFKDRTKLSDDDIDRLISGLWNCSLTIDGERKTLADWAKQVELEQLRAVMGMSVAEKKKLQKESNEKVKKGEVKPVHGDINNIRESLPFLLPDQQLDVQKAEIQHYDDSHKDMAHGNGKGYMFTNATGTGKTYTGAGIVRRFVNEGKGRILIVTVSKDVEDAWISALANMGVESRALKDTKDAGKGVVLSLYEGFYQNKAILKDTFDLVIYDESQRIQSEAKGTITSRAEQHHMVSNRDVRQAILRTLQDTPLWQRGEEIEEEYENLAKMLADYDKKQTSKLADEIRKLGGVEGVKERMKQLKAELGRLEKEKEAATNAAMEDPEQLKAAQEAVDRTKVVFLSATPFNTPMNIDYAEGYIFSYQTKEGGNDAGLIAAPTVDQREAARTNFIVNNFGSSYGRTGKGARKKGKIEDLDAANEEEVAWNSFVSEDLGTLSGRMLSSEYDYSREFPRLDFEQVEEFNDAVAQLLRGEFAGMVDCFDSLLKNYSTQTALFEIIKTPSAIERAKEHIAKGRKVVIFHRRKSSSNDIQPPFAEGLAKARALKDKYYDDLANKFEQRYKRLLAWERGQDFDSFPQDIIVRAFATDKEKSDYSRRLDLWHAGGEKGERPRLKAAAVGVYNGDEKAKDKKAAIENFNNDLSPQKVIVIQVQSGREGISLHDTTGKYPRAQISLYLPQSPIEFVQSEGRTYRFGNKSNVIFEYPMLGLDIELSSFAYKINERSQTTENLAMGSAARGLRKSISRAALASRPIVVGDGMGTGGKALDDASLQGRTDYDRALSNYGEWSQESQAGVPFAERDIPDPIGFKMAEWGMPESGETVLVADAGVGTVARYVSGKTKLVATEGSVPKHARLVALVGGAGSKVLNISLSEYGKVNKADVIICKAGQLKEALNHGVDCGRFIVMAKESELEGTKGLMNKLFKENKRRLSSEIILPETAMESDGEKVHILVYDVREYSGEEAYSPVETKVTDLSDMGDANQVYEQLRNVTVPEREIDIPSRLKKRLKKHADKLKTSKLVKKRKNYSTGKMEADVENDNWRFRFSAAPHTVCFPPYGGMYRYLTFTIDYRDLAKKNFNEIERLAKEWVEFTDMVRGDADCHSGYNCTDDAARDIYQICADAIKDALGKNEMQIRNLANGISENKLPSGVMDMQRFREAFDALNSENEELKMLANRVFAAAGKIEGMTIKTVPASKMESAHAVACYTITGGKSYLLINEEAFNSIRLTDDFKAQTLVHELIHSVSSYYLHSYTSGDTAWMSEEQKNACKDILSIYKQLTEDSSFRANLRLGSKEDDNAEYGLTNEREMMAELANPVFRRALKGKDFWRQIINGTEKLLGMDVTEEEGTKTNALNELERTLNTLMDGYDQSAYETFESHFLGGNAPVLVNMRKINTMNRLAEEARENHDTFGEAAAIAERERLRRENERIEKEQTTQRRAGEMAVEALRKKGVEVITDVDEMQRVLDEARRKGRGGQQMLFAGMKGMFISRADAAQRWEDFRTAQEMEGAGKGAYAIKVATGWERGVDGKWRYEIPDFGVDLDVLKERVKRVEDGEGNFDNAPLTLRDVQKGADELFDSYPSLADIKIKVRKAEDMGDVRGYYQPARNTITLNDALMKGDARYAAENVASTLTHEVQHAIQWIEGFSDLGSSWNIMHRADLEGRRTRAGRQIDLENERTELKKKLEETKEKARKSSGWEKERWEKEGMSLVHSLQINSNEINSLEREIAKEGYEEGHFVYNELSTEVEARNAARRRNMLGTQRRRTLADETEDVARKDQVILRNGIYYDAGGQAIGRKGQFLKTADGEILGFVHEGKVYLDPSALDANTPVHEYTHLWDTALRKSDPKLWKEGVELMKQTPLWEQVKNDPQYKDIANDENLLASEVHSRLTGEEGRKYFEQLAQEARDAKGPLEQAEKISLMEQLRRWLDKALKWAKDKLFGKPEMTVEEFRDMPLKDLLSEEAAPEGEEGAVRYSRRGKEGDNISDSRFSTQEAQEGGETLERQQSAEERAQQESENEALRGAMGERVNELVKELHLGDAVDIRESADGLTGRAARSKGWYDPRTGRVTIILSNNADLSDVEATVFHEATTHKGLRVMLGDKFDSWLDRVYRNVHKGARVQINALARKNGWNFRRATDEYLAGLSEDGKFLEAIKTGTWRKIRYGLSDMLRQLGFNIDISDDELRYALWRSHQNLKEGARSTILAEASDIAMQHKLQVGNFAPEESELQFRDRKRAAAETQRDLTYVGDRMDRIVRSGWFQTKESMQDSNQVVYDFCKQVYKALGKKWKGIEDVRGFENPYINENRWSSKVKAQVDEMAHRLFAPMYDEVMKLARNNREERELDDYMLCKHGLERNRYMAERNAREAYEKKARESGKDVPGWDELSAEQREKLTARYRGDYAGLTSLFPEAEDFAELTGLAEAAVRSYEDAHDTGPLWERVNAVNKDILKKEYDCGMLSRETYEKIRDMYENYIPLRGFEETTSDEVYAYVNSFNTAFNAPIKVARGRTSRADSPFINMEQMAESAIMEGLRNQLIKQRFLNFVRNHPTDYVSESPLWLRYNKENEVWEAVFPDLEGLEDGDAVAARLEAFEQRMQELADEYPEEYKKSSDDINIPYRVLGSKALQEHQVLVKVGGKDVVLTINGSPRLAQAINGKTNPDAVMQGVLGAAVRAAGGWNRYLSQVYTTWNPDFIVGNFARDMVYAHIMAGVKESPRYAANFMRNFVTSFSKIVQMTDRQRRGKLDMSDPTERLFDQFIKEGGETGYVSMYDAEEMKRKVGKMMRNRLSEKTRRVLNKLGEVVNELNRAAEMCARFAAFKTSMEAGRGVDRSIWDGKEITVNFNKKGAGDRFYRANGQTWIGNRMAALSSYGRNFRLFWNVHIQGPMNMWRAGLRNWKKFVPLLGVLFAGGFLQSFLRDDEDEYFDLPDYVRRQNVVARRAFGEGWIRWPLAHELRPIYAMGEVAGYRARGLKGVGRRLSRADLWTGITEAIFNEWPIDIVDSQNEETKSNLLKFLLVAFTPSFIQPLTEAMSNRAWTGLPIYKDTPYNKDMPEYTKAYANTGKGWVALSRWMNRISGGNSKRKGEADFNPAQWEYVFNNVVPGSTFMSEVSNMMQVGLGEKDFDWRYMPFANRFVMNGDERTQDRAVRSEYVEMATEARKTRELYNRYLKAWERGEEDEDYEGLIERMEDSKEFGRMLIMEEYDKAIKDDYDLWCDESLSEDEREEVYNEMMELTRECVKAMEEYERTGDVRKSLGGE